MQVVPPVCAADDRDDLVQRNMPLVFKIANKFRRIAAERGIDFDELVSSGAVAMWKAVCCFDETKGTFVTLAYGRIQWAMLGVLRRHKSRAVSWPTNGFGEPVDVAEAAGVGIEEQQSRAEQVEQMLRSLPDRERALVVGHFLHGYRFRELATKNGITTERARQLVRRAVQRLRERFACDLPA